MSRPLQIQSTINTSINEILDNHNTTEIFSTISSGSIETSTSKNCNNYSFIEIIAESSQSNISVMLQWSQDDTNWYNDPNINTTTPTTDVDSSSNPQDIVFISSKTLAKCCRVRIYNPGPSTADVNLLFNRTH